jgi:hypothetical protein
VCPCIIWVPFLAVNAACSRTAILHYLILRPFYSWQGCVNFRTHCFRNTCIELEQVKIVFDAEGPLKHHITRANAHSMVSL